MTDGPFRLAGGEQRILGDDDPGDGVKPARLGHRHPAPDVAGAELGVGPDLPRRRDFRAIGEVAGVVLHVDDEGVDLGPIGQLHQLVKALPAERPRVDEDRAHDGNSARAGLDHVSEVFDGDLPQAPGGTFAQAWNTGELLRARAMAERGQP